MTRLEIAARIFAGLSANPYEDDLNTSDCAYALKLAQILIDEDRKMDAGSGEGKDD